MANDLDTGTSRPLPVFSVRRLFRYTLGISIACHILALLGTLLSPPWSEKERVPPLMVKLEPPPQKFAKRPPPAQRPLARPQQPQPVQRPLSRKVSPKLVPRVAMSPVPLSDETPRAGMPGVGGGTGGGNLFSAGKGSGGLLGMGIGPGGGVPSRHIGPKFQAGAVEGSRTEEGEIDLGVEMLDVQALNTGKYRAVVIVNPKDKKQIKGFLSLSSVYSEGIERAELDNPFQRRGNSMAGIQPVSRQVAERQTLQGLADQLTERTQVQAEVLDGIPLDDPRLLKVPFLLLTTNSPSFTFTQAEAGNLGRYLLAGGFLYAEALTFLTPNYRPDQLDPPALRSLIRAAFAQVGCQEGKDWRFVRLEQGHPLYHCFYDLDTLPRGFRDVFFEYVPEKAELTPTPFYLEGISIGSRLAGVYSLKDYADFWAGEAERRRERGSVYVGWRYRGGEEQKVYELGINILVFALTQEGSLAQRLVSLE